jgi:plasmid stabilization system protein ParE
MKIRYRARALADLEDIFLYLNARSPSGATNVLQAIRAAIVEISEHPMAAQSTSAFDIRVRILGRYRYKIFYSVQSDFIEIIHVRHAARRPWGGARP